MTTSQQDDLAAFVMSRMAFPGLSAQIARLLPQLGEAGTLAAIRAFHSLDAHTLETQRQVEGAIRYVSQTWQATGKLPGAPSSAVPRIADVSDRTEGAMAYRWCAQRLPSFEAMIREMVVTLGDADNWLVVEAAIESAKARHATNV